MDGYELHGHLSEQLFSAIVDCFANFSSSVGSVSEEIYSLQAVYFSYTLNMVSSRMPKGAILIFDQVNCSAFPGETIALDEVLGISNISLKRGPLQPYSTYAIIGE